MLDATVVLYSVLALILAAEFVNGWTDSPNAIATVVSTRVLSPYQAVIMATVLNAIGAMSGTAVAATVGKDIVSPDVINLTTVAAAMVAIIFWSTLAWYYGLPTSESHALIASLSGAALATADGSSPRLASALISRETASRCVLMLEASSKWVGAGFSEARPPDVACPSARRSNSRIRRFPMTSVLNS